MLMKLTNREETNRYKFVLAWNRDLLMILESTKQLRDLNIIQDIRCIKKARQNIPLGTKEISMLH